MSLNPNHPYAPHRSLRPWPNEHPFALNPPDYARRPYVFASPYEVGVFYTPLGERLARGNPSLYTEVKEALIRLDRGRESRYRFLIAG
jgi:hypothetical protein